MPEATTSKVCQTCKHCTPKDAKEGMGLFCNSPNVILDGYKDDEKIAQDRSSATSIFWAVLKHCGEKREFWEGR